MANTVLVIGSGGREHTLAWKLAQSESVKHVFVSPGNAGTSSDELGKISNCDLNVKDHAVIADWCKENKISLVVVGPEDPLANGLSDYLDKNGVMCFGPCQKAAQIEASKEFAKYFMDRYEIPTARWKSFTCTDVAKNYILNAPYNALVVKASGLAAGKGVIVADSFAEAANAVETLKQDESLSSASEVIVIEELLKGEEVSVLCFSDGKHISVMPPAQDHKRLLDNDKGPNTGGMGAYCPCPQVSEQLLKVIEKEILQKAVDGMSSEGTPYVGVLYAGLMLTEDGPKVLEFNCRFGDPETQAILPLLKSDLYEVMYACVNGTLHQVKVEWDQNKFAAGVVLVSGGYPSSYPKGKVITGLDKVISPNRLVFHAGTAASSGNIVTSGGRVLAVVALDNNLQNAVSSALDGAQNIHFDGAFYRKDIAQRALKRSPHEGMTYRSAGVNIETADALVEKIKFLTKQTVTKGVCGGIGGFGGIFDIKAAGYSDPLLVSAASSIGEKLMAAKECGKLHTIGYDLVSNGVNQILSRGAEPLFFLDTFTTGKLDPDAAAKVIEGIVEACKDANCALIGGETAEMPGMYNDGDFDLNGYARGAVEKSQVLPQNKIVSGDVIIAIFSEGVNSDSYKIIRNLLAREDLDYNSPAPFEKTVKLGDILLRKNKIYVQSVLPLMKQNLIKAAAYVNEGGLTRSLLNILPVSHRATVDASKWVLPPVFKWIANTGNFSEETMFANFNCGIDMVLVVDKDLESTFHRIIESLKVNGEKAAVVGVIESANDSNKIQILNSNFGLQRSSKKVKVAILASSPGLNMQALVNHCHSDVSTSAAEISLLIIDASDENMLNKKFDISTLILDFLDFKAEVSLLDEQLNSAGVEFICLDNTATLLPDGFIQKWKGKILNIHPSLLPAFNSPNALQEVLDLQARITGSTVYFLKPGQEIGDIIDQVALFVNVGDTIEDLQQKVNDIQQYLYPKALELVAQKSDKSIGSCTPVLNTDETLPKKVRSLIASTARPGFVSGNDSLCSVFDLKASGYESALLVSGTDGVGTKLKIAQKCNKHDTIGIDLVAMSVNDIVTHGAEPLFFMVSYNCGMIKEVTTTDIVSGVVNGCKQANCALTDFATAVLPEMYLNKSDCLPDFNNYDVVGYAEGALSKENLLPRTNEINEDDLVIGLSSSGPHSNGYSLIGKIVEIRKFRYQDPAPFDPSKTLGEALLTPTKIYVQALLPLMRKGYVKAAAHITGGGLTENIPRILPASSKVILDGSKWVLPPVFKWLAAEGRISEKEMLRTFNCGLGMVLIINKKHETEVLKILTESGEQASTIGCVKACSKGEEKVEVRNFHISSNYVSKKRKRVGVLISGSGTNLQALIDYCQHPSNQSSAEIVLVLSNVPDVEGLKRAERANIPTRVLSHKTFKTRVEFDMAVNAILQENKIDIVCLAGFMRILSKEFVKLWQGKLLNVHPAILPAFKGVNAHKLVLIAGARITGCTVHFVEAEVDAGAIIAQAAVRVDVNDTEKSLQEKVKVQEHEIFPKALELLASERISRGPDGKLIWNY